MKFQKSNANANFLSRIRGQEVVRDSTADFLNEFLDMEYQKAEMVKELLSSKISLTISRNGSTRKALLERRRVFSNTR